MTNTKRLQYFWDSKDLSGVFAIFTDDAAMKMHHENKTLSGDSLREELTSMVEDEETVSREFRIIYENNECLVRYDCIGGQFFRVQVSIVQLWRDGHVYHMEVSKVTNAS